MGNKSKFKRVTDLFNVGVELVLEEHGDEGPVLVWVNKLNSFEQEEARKDGAVGRAQVIMRLEDPDSEEMSVFDSAMVGRDKEAFVRALLGLKRNELYVKALDDIRAIPEWTEKMEVLERGDALLADRGRDADPGEVERLGKLNGEYVAKIQDIVDELEGIERQDLENFDLAELQEKYREEYRESAATQGFLTEFRTTEVFYALRDCHASTKGENGRWDHTSCDHRVRLLDARSDVRELPEALIGLVRQAIQDLNMTPRDAGNSAAPTSSSASSEQPSAAEASTPSTPTGI